MRIYSLLAPCPTESQQDTTDTTTGSIALGPFPATANCYYHQFSLGAEATETGVVEAQVWDKGVVALTGAGRFVDLRIPLLQSFLEMSIYGDATPPQAPQTLPAPSIPGFSRSAGPLIPTAWTFISPDASNSGLLEVLFSPPAASSTSTDGAPEGAGGTVISLDSVSGSSDMRLSRGPFSSILSSPNGKLLSLLTAEKILWVVSADFQRSLSEFNIIECDSYKDALSRSTSSTNDLGGLGGTGIRQIQWCGNNTVALAWDNEVVLVGPFGESLRYFYSSSVHLASELDGVRIIGADKMEFIQKMADSTSAVFRPGSSDPAALLVDAARSYGKGSAKADEELRAIKYDLSSAVDVCIDAACHEWDPVWQRSPLNAALLGKAFLDSRKDPLPFIDINRALRVLNNARSPDIGIPMTYEQYESIGPSALIDRLTNRNHHFLALRIAADLPLGSDRILQHWARAKIARSAPGPAASAAAKVQQDDELCELIVERFRGMGASIAASYSSIASSAYRAGRVRLATKLLDHEARAVDQVPLLLRMGEDKVALQKSVESGDTDLVYHVLLRLKNQLSRGDFFRVVQSPALDLDKATEAGSGTKRPPSQSSSIAYQQLALRLLEVYASEYDRELLKDLYFTDDRRVEAAMLALQEAARAQRSYTTRTHLKPDQTAPEESLTTVSTKLKEASKLFNEDRERNLEHRLVEEEARLLAFQAVLENEDGHLSSWVGQSVNETIRNCLIKSKTSAAMFKKAEKLKNDFKVTEKRWCTLRVDAFVKTRDWDGLWTFADTRRPPVMGFEPIIVKLLQVKADSEALRYVSKVMSIGDKTDRAKFR